MEISYIWAAEETWERLIIAQTYGIFLLRAFHQIITFSATWGKSTAQLPQLLL